MDDRVSSTKDVDNRRGMSPYLLFFAMYAFATVSGVILWIALHFQPWWLLLVIIAAAIGTALFFVADRRETKAVMELEASREGRADG